MRFRTSLKLIALFFIHTVLWTDANAQSWQLSKKLGCNKKYTANDRPRLISKLKDSRGNQYLHYYVTGDTFYYDNFVQKRYIRGGDAHAICKIRCDGSLAWSKIITHDVKNTAELRGERVKMFFGDNENCVVISGISYTTGTNFYIDSDTVMSAFKEYTIVYDSNGVAIKKFVDKPKSQGRSLATGYFPHSHRYFFYEYIDSTATDRLFFNGKFLPRGEYFIVLDSNMNYFKINPVTLFSKPRVLWDTSQPAELTQYQGFLLPAITFHSKTVILNSYEFKPNDLYVGRYAVVGKDSFKIYNESFDRSFNILMSYNDTGGQEWASFCYSLVSSNGIDAFVKDGSEIYLKRDNSGIWMYKNIQINCSNIDGTYQAVVFKIDSNGNFLWKDSLIHKDYNFTGSLHSADVNSRHELVWNYDFYSDDNSTTWFKVGDRYYENNTPTPPFSSGYTKNLIVALGKGTQRVIDTTTEGIRRTLTTHVSVDAADNVWLFGSKEIDGRILNNDSTPLQYGTGNDLFIAKHGQAHCYCDPLVSNYTVTDNSIEGRISVQYTGSATDSVVFLWGDGTKSIAKPSTTPVTKIYNKTITISIAAVAYNNCYRTDTFRRTIPITCTPPHAAFVLLDSNTKNIRIKYVGTPTDTVTYHWGDGNTAKLANPQNKITSYTFTTSVDSVYISARIKSVCGDRDTSGRWYVFCPRPKKSFILDTSKLSSRILSVQYSGADSLWVYWGDGTMSYKPNGIKIYNSYGVYTISIILKSSCGKLDTTKYTLTIGTSGIENTIREDIIISPNPVREYIQVFGSKSSAISKIELFNIQGQSIITRDISANSLVSANTGITIDVRSLPMGTYFLQIRNPNRQLIFSDKIIIER